MGVDDTGIHTNPEDHHQMLEERADMRSDREVEEEGRPYEREWKLVEVCERMNSGCNRSK